MAQLLQRLLCGIIAIALCPVSRAYAEKRYYWFDNERSNLNVSQSAPDIIDSSALQAGLHTFNVGAECDGVPSSVRSALFIAGSGAHNYRYWFDNRSDSILTVGGDMRAIDCTGLSYGLHSIHFFGEVGGFPSPVESRWFYRTRLYGSESKLIIYVDDEYYDEVNVTTAELMSIDLYMPDIEKGRHKLGVRWVTADGIASPIAEGEFEAVEITGRGTVTLAVFDVNGNEITDNVSIEWYDSEGKSIGSGTNINGISKGAELYYSVILPEDLGRIYREVKTRRVHTETDNDTILCTLDKIDKVSIQGRVTALGADNTDIKIAVRQLLNGKYEHSLNTITDEQGSFLLNDVFDDYTEITISCDGCLDVNLRRNGFAGNGDLGIISMNPISGFIVIPIVSVIESVKESEISTDVGMMIMLQDIEFELTNLTRGAEITDFIVQGNNLVIRSGASAGEEIKLIAKSKKGEFHEAVTNFQLTDDSESFELEVMELGGLDATLLSSDNGQTAGYLFDSTNNIAAKSSYKGNVLSLRHLPEGEYTLVSIGVSSALGSFQTLSDLASVGLKENQDYTVTRFSITDGRISDVCVDMVPRIESTHLSYLTDLSYFNTNKHSINPGDFLTFSVRLDLKPEYSSKAENLKIIVDLPEGCTLTANSIIANRKPVPYTLSGTRLTMSPSKEQSQCKVMFCAMPTVNKRYIVTALASFADGAILPVGSVEFEAKGLSLNAPSSIITDHFTVSGNAPVGCLIEIYDDDILIGKTQAKGDGSWQQECILLKPYAPSFHNIYAKITTPEGLELISETQSVEYNADKIVPLKTSMTFYNGWYKKNVTVDFDHLSGAASPSHFSFYTTTDFTFITEFTRNDSSLVKNVTLNILNNDGTLRTLPTTFDSRINRWVASTKYSSRSLPTNVSVDFDLIPEKISYDSTRVKNDINQFANLIQNYVMNADSTKCALIDTTATSLTVKYQTYTMDEPIFMHLEELNHDEWAPKLNEMDYVEFSDGETVFCVYDTIVSERFIQYVWNLEGQQLFLVEISRNNDFSTIDFTNQISRATPDFSIGNRVMRMPILDLFFNASTIYSIINDFNNGYNELQHWQAQYKKICDDHYALFMRTQALIDDRCSDGDYRLSDYMRTRATSNLKDLYRFDVSMMHNEFSFRLDQIYDNIKFQRQQAILYGTISALINVATEGLSAGMSNAGSTLVIPVIRKLRSFPFCINGRPSFTFEEFIAGYIQSSAVNMGILFEQYIVSSLYDSLNTYETETFLTLEDWFYPANTELIRKFTSLQDQIRKYYNDCPEDKDIPDDPPYYDNDGNAPHFNGSGSTPILDPSGFVYEGVPSNRLEGVIATCYQQMSSGEPEFWNAEEYSQTNPLKTDDAGFYSWEVPMGLWQVKYEKEGYETTMTEWLPVPPPQLDVNIGMRKISPATLKEAHAYEDEVIVEMDTYMDGSTLTSGGNIYLTVDGNRIDNAMIEFVDGEGTDPVLASRLRIVPTKPFEADKVALHIGHLASTYCGVPLDSDIDVVLPVEPKLRSLDAPARFEVTYGGTASIKVKALPGVVAEGHTLNVALSSSLLLGVDTPTATFDVDGYATINVAGLLPGNVVLTFSVEGYDLTATTVVTIGQSSSSEVSAPEASIPSGSMVYEGTEVTLTCDTPDAVIYYTIDGSCPCDPTSTRRVYNGPIVINTDVIIKAIAIVDGIESDIAVFVYTIEELNSIGKVDADTEVKVYPIPAVDLLNIKAAAFGEFDAALTSTAGVVVMAQHFRDGHGTLDVSSLPSGFYILTLRSGSSTRNIRVVKR